MGEHDMGTPGFLFISFWGVYYLFHIVVFAKNCIFESIRKKYPHYYDNYSRIVNVEHKTTNWHDNAFDLRTIAKEGNINHNIKLKKYEVETNNIIV